MNPSVRDIVAEYLKEKGYDGLYNDSNCACEISDLIPCGNGCEDCEAGYKINCPPYCKEGCAFHITEIKPKNKSNDGTTK